MSEQELSELENVEDFTKFWIENIDQARKLRDQWFKEAQEARNTYYQKSRRNFNILFSNVEIRLGLRYSSTPIPDVRPMFMDMDKPSREAAKVIERAISKQLDGNSFDDAIENAVKSDEITGLGQVRIIWEPVQIEEEQQGQVSNLIQDERVRVIYVPFGHYLEGPAHSWDEVEWVAFKLFLTKEEVNRIKPDIENDLEWVDRIDTVTKEEEENYPTNERLKSDTKVVECWQIWDKNSRKVITIAECYQEGPLDISTPSLNLKDFFPCPKPLMMISLDGSRVPKCPYEYYRYHAETLETISARIQNLSRLLKYRGIFASELAQEVGKISDLEDGEFASSSNAMALLSQTTGLSQGIWAYPIEVIVQVIRELTNIEFHEKQTIYEITGISDIMRGATQQYETARAQSLKSEYGSFRISKSQKEVERFARDTVNLIGEVIGDNFQVETLMMIYRGPISGEALQILQGDYIRNYTIDIETDSTRRGDIAKVREDMNNFLDATAKFAQVMAPLIAEKMVPRGVVLKLFYSFASIHNLGKQAQVAIDDFITQAEEREPEEQQREEQKQQEAEQHQQQLRELAIAEQQAKVEQILKEIQLSHARMLETYGELRSKVEEIAMKQALSGESNNSGKEENRRAPNGSEA